MKFISMEYSNGPPCHRNGTRSVNAVTPLRWWMTNFVFVNRIDLLLLLSGSQTWNIDPSVSEKLKLSKMCSSDGHFSLAINFNFTNGAPTCLFECNSINIYVEASPLSECCVFLKRRLHGRLHVLELGHRAVRVKCGPVNKTVVSGFIPFKKWLNYDQYYH